MVSPWCSTTGKRYTENYKASTNSSYYFIIKSSAVTEFLQINPNVFTGCDLR